MSSKTAKKAKSVNTKDLTGYVSDFVKLYAIDLITPSAADDKRAVEADLITKIKSELEKH